MAVVGDVLTAPEVGWRRYDDTHSLIYYSSGWTTISNSNFYNSTVKQSSSTTDVIKIVFKGSKVRIISASNGTTGAIGSTNVTVVLNGTEYTTNNYNSTVIYQQITFEKLDLQYGYHTIEIKKTDTNWAWFDAIDIDEDGELIRHDYFDNLPYDEVTRKYGVAWFGFDEASGNVYDKLGSNYVGAVTGTSRVTGWNGEGNAMGFNGSSYVTFNSKIIPIGKKTIRFKFKLTAIPTAVSVIFSESYYATGQYGTYAYVAQNTSIVSLNVHKNGLNIVGITTPPLTLNKWHDIIFSWDGTTEKTAVKLFVDSELVRVGTSSSTETNTAISNLHIGSYSDKNYKLSNAQIDDFQIYSKAITPADFTQNHIAIKTSYNKNLVLPVREGRVKELPTVEEVDLINQGYTWREIDNAVDGGIDLTQTTTEYEIVSKANSTLGNGKVFTIPVNDFKTIKIEDNY